MTNKRKMTGKIQILKPDAFDDLLFPTFNVKIKVGGYGSFESATLDFP